jgi:hypothetical protein
MPAYRYFPEPRKKDHNHKIARSTFQELQFKVQTGSCYIGTTWAPELTRKVGLRKDLLSLDQCCDCLDFSCS